ncbi:hypothetical protein WMY93_022800 [Mugilogobius chulae]|uniref:Uncharacterized protein n=1 Tax=Mugilogobius chulae TaxID=88201 RepID=A0AAW0N9H8_9GOBI
MFMASDISRLRVSPQHFGTSTRHPSGQVFPGHLAPARLHGPVFGESEQTEPELSSRGAVSDSALQDSAADCKPCSSPDQTGSFADSLYDSFSSCTSQRSNQV